MWVQGILSVLFYISVLSFCICTVIYVYKKTTKMIIAMCVSTMLVGATLITIYVSKILLGAI